MDKTLLVSSTLFTNLFSEYERKKNKELRASWEQLRKDIQHFKQVHTLKFRLNTDINCEIKDIAKELLAIEHYATETIPSLMPDEPTVNPNHHFSVAPLKEMRASGWPVLGYFGQLRIIDVFDTILNEVAFFFALYRTEFCGVDKKILQIKKEVNAIKNNCCLVMSLENQLSTDIERLHRNVKTFQTQLNKTPDKGVQLTQTHFDKDVAVLNTIIEEESKLRVKFDEGMGDLQPEADDADIDAALVESDKTEAEIEAALAEAAQDLEEYMKKEEGIESPFEEPDFERDADIADIKGEGIKPM